MNSIAVLLYSGKFYFINDIMPRRGALFIVPVVEIMQHGAIAVERHNSHELYLALLDFNTTTQWLARRRLIANNHDCAACNNSYSLINNRGIDEKRWSCSRCKSTKSIRENSFFEKSHLSLFQIIMFTYWWAVGAPQELIQRETSIAHRTTVIDWANFCREECENYFQRHNNPIGKINYFSFLNTHFWFLTELIKNKIYL